MHIQINDACIIIMNMKRVAGRTLLKRILLLPVPSPHEVWIPDLSQWMDSFDRWGRKSNLIVESFWDSVPEWSRYPGKQEQRRKRNGLSTSGMEPSLIDFDRQKNLKESPDKGRAVDSVCWILFDGKHVSCGVSLWPGSFHFPKITNVFLFYYCRLNLKFCCSPMDIKEFAHYH